MSHDKAVSAVHAAGQGHSAGSHARAHAVITEVLKGTIDLALPSGAVKA